MRVVEMDGDLRRKCIEARVVAFVAAGDVAKAAGDEKILLDETQFLAGCDGIGRVKDFRNRLRSDLLLHRPQIVAVVEDLHVEVM